MSARSDTVTPCTTLEDRVAAEVRSELARRQMQQSELAARLEEHHSWVSKRFYARNRRITVDDLERTARALDVSVADLLPPDARQGSRVTARYRDQAKQLDQDCPYGRPLAGDESSVRIDIDSRPRRLSRRISPMPIMQAAAA